MFHKALQFLASLSNNYLKENKKEIHMTTSKQSSKELLLDLKSEGH